MRTGENVLTSAESMRLLKEKTPEKLKRKSSRKREEKKEEEKKQKSEARVLKAAERHAKQGIKGRRGPKRKAPSRMMIL